MRRRRPSSQKHTSHPQTTKPRLRANLWADYWFGPVAAVRPYLLVKGVLLLLAFDVWILRVKSAGLYGIDGFNVAHFHWLDGLQPVPTAAFFTVLLVGTGLLALLCAFSVPSRTALALLALSYTYSWTVSMLDGYQHHYFLSLVLVAFVFFPRLSARDLYEPKRGREVLETAATVSRTSPLRVSAWGYALLGVNVAIVYFFTAVTKATDERFMSGEVVQWLSKKNQLLQPLEAWLVGLGLPSDVFWHGLALGTVAVEIFLSVAYLLAIKKESVRSRWLKVVTALGFLLVVGFHGIGNELVLALRIGWFSYYMIALGAIYFLPESFLWMAGRILTWPVLGLSKTWSSFAAALDRRGAALTIFFTVTGSLIIAFVIGVAGFTLDLPGVALACLLVAFIVAGLALAAVFVRRHKETLSYVFGAGLAVGLMWLTITLSMVRFDYYDRVGAYHQDRGNREAAIEAYEKAIGYVPIGKRNLSRQGEQAGAAAVPAQDSDTIIVDGSQ